MSDAAAANDLYRLIDGYKITQAIHVAAVLGIADHIAAGRSTSDAIAASANANAPAVYRLLRTLAAIGVLHESGERMFTLTPMGECLRTDAAYPLAPFATLTGQAYYWNAWGHLLHGVKTGENVFKAVHGVGSWTYRERHPDQNVIFYTAMTANARRVDPAIASAIDVTGVSRVADIGGGQGSLLLTLLRAHPDLHGVLFDRPSVVASSAPAVAEAGVADRLDAIGGDMFDAVPGGCDRYILKFILHDWEDDEAVAILRACRRAMAAEARVLVVERLIGPPNEHLAAKLSDLNMLVGPGGRERTREEFAALFETANLRLVRIDATTSDLNVIVGAPA